MIIKNGVVANIQYIDRGDPASVDKAVGDFTTDETWNDLDLSAIVPAGAIAILFNIQVKDDAADSSMLFRENGNSNAYNVASVRTQVANVISDADLIVSCDAGRVIEYYGSNLAFVSIDLTVRGWFI